MSKQYIVIPIDEFKDIYAGYLSNEALECGGVDNWEWCGESMKDYAQGKDWHEFVEKEIAEVIKNSATLNIDLEDK